MRLKESLSTCFRIKCHTHLLNCQKWWQNLSSNSVLCLNINCPFGQSTLNFWLPKRIFNCPRQSGRGFVAAWCITIISNCTWKTLNAKSFKEGTFMIQNDMLYHQPQIRQGILEFGQHSLEKMTLLFRRKFRNYLSPYCTNSQFHWQEEKKNKKKKQES